MTKNIRAALPLASALALLATPLAAQETPAPEAPQEAPAIAAEPPMTMLRMAEIIRAIDPDLVDAAADVDRVTLQWSLSLTPLERLRHSQSMARAIGRLRRAKQAS